MDYKYFGILSVSILTAGLLFVVYKWPAGKDKTFSQHVAVKNSSIIYYNLLFVIVLPLLVTFFLRWFTQYFGISPLLNIVVALSAIFQFACSLIPEVGGRMTKWHTTLAGISALLLLPILPIISATKTLSIFERVVPAVFFIVMLLCIFLVARAKGRPDNFLLIQSAYFAAFFIPVMIISYL